MKDLFASNDASSKGERIDLPGAELQLYLMPDLGADADRLFTELRENVAWREESISLFGKRYLQPRLLSWYGDPEARYRYSGVVHEPQPWLPRLADLRDRLQCITGALFNSVLANLYRDHRDSMGLHADDEPELGERPVIGSLSLGEERVFRLKHRHDKTIKPLRIRLTPGSLLVMRGDTQRNWKHEVPKQRRTCGPRINLTFRRVFPDI